MNAAPKFITNHARVLAYFSTHPDATARIAALDLDITERSVLMILGELAQAGYLYRHRHGRRMATETRRSADMDRLVEAVNELTTR